MTLLAPDDPRWTTALARLEHDVYHLPGYVSVCAEEEGGEPRAYLYEDGANVFLCPLIVRAIQDSRWHDAASPYGYPGPLCSGPHEFLESALARFLSELRDVGIVSVFVRCHTLLGAPSDILARHGVLVDHGSTVSVDLALPAEALEQQLRDNHRRDIEKLVRRGAWVDRDGDWRHLPEFMLAYRQTMRRVGATSGYFFAERYFQRLHDALGPHVHLFTARVMGRIAAAGLFFELCGIVQYHLGGTFDEHVDANAMKLLLHEVSLWARARGARVHHLGGGVGAQDDALLHFKSGFSPRRHAFRTWRAICAPEPYQDLVRAWEVRAGRAADSSGRFFPAYRALG